MERGDKRSREIKVSHLPVYRIDICCRDFMELNEDSSESQTIGTWQSSMLSALAEPR